MKTAVVCFDNCFSCRFNRVQIHDSYSCRKLWHRRRREDSRLEPSRSVQHSRRQCRVPCTACLKVAYCLDSKISNRRFRRPDTKFGADKRNASAVRQSNRQRRLPARRLPRREFPESASPPPSKAAREFCPVR